jgi:hypothetical protein
MAYRPPDDDCDSTFGEDSFLWSISMQPPSSAPLAGTKRAAEDIGDSKTRAAGLAASEEYQADHIDPQALCCSTCPDLPPCTAFPDSRPSKRTASVQKVSEYHGTAEGCNTDSNSDHFFLDTCFRDFCQGLECDATCSSPCTPCAGDGECSATDACYDPHCDQSCDQEQCFDSCVDPDCTKACTKISCPNEPCFCQKCEVQPCPLGEPNNACHLAHSAPDQAGTIFCYDDARCHFQSNYQYSHPQLPPYDSQPCYSQSHGTIGNCNVPRAASATPVLAPGNYTPLDNLSHQSSPYPTSTSAPPQCFLNIDFDHCHNGDPCCHGATRQCGDIVSQMYSSVWNAPMTPRSGLENAFMNFGFASPSDAPQLGASALNGMQNSMFSFDSMPWALSNVHISSMAATVGLESNRQLDAISTLSLGDMGEYTESTPLSRPTTSTSSGPCTCRWQHAGLLCLLSFDTPEALHKHIKAAHIDNCAGCFCQWEGCESSGKDFKQRSKLSRHLLGHAGHRPYACGFEGCGKTFATNQAKDNHERTHTGIRPYVCEHCGYTTTTYTQLQTHVSAKHLNNKPHQCRFCDFTCADSSNLSKHERTHQVFL